MFTFRLLKAVAAVVSMALFFWGVAMHTTALVGAASISSVSNTLSDSEPNVPANHTIVFTTPTGIANGQTITLDFSDGPFTGTSSIGVLDIDVQDGATDLSVAANCAGADQVATSFSGAVLTVTFCSGDGASIAANGTTTIEIGNHASSGGGGSNRLINPATGNYAIVIDGAQTDEGSTRVVIIDMVEVTASVDTTFTFTVTGVGGGAAVNGTSTTGSSTATRLAFGTLVANVASTTAQDLTVTTNASQGFVITVEQDSEFISSSNAIIDSFRNGEYTSTPRSWESPAATPGDPTTFGHWGLTSDDIDTTRSEQFASNTWVAASTTPVVVMSHNAPVDGTGTGQGTTRVGYQVEISALQEAATDYATRLRYIATPIF